MMELSRQQKQEALDAMIKKLRDGQVPMEQDSLPMEAAPLEEMTPEKAAELAKGRSPASVNPNSDMVAVPLEDFMPAGSYVGQKLGQQVSPDLQGVPEAPVAETKEERLAKLKALFQSK